ncbi:hypothetical protein [Endozoicomonas sp. Mp262]|uniref:WD40 repeat domain-containing protein n=1 Tax=Endozoicomonas sp. Mp262 TaxID=2919499 RepID=UPI0021DA3DD5
MVEFCKKYFIVSSTTPCLRGTLQVYDINQDFHPMLTLWGDEGIIKTMTATSKYVVSGTDDTLKVWDPLKGKCCRTLKGHKGHVSSLTTWNNLIISGSDEIRVWNPETGECLSTLVINEKKPKKVRHMSTNQDGILLSCAYDGKIRYWDISQIE